MKYKLSNYVIKNIKYLIIIILLIIVVTICDLKLPDYMAKIIDIGIKNNNISYIYEIGFNMIIFTIIGMIANIIIGYFSSVLSNKISHDIRDDLYKKIISLEYNIIENFSNSSLINRLTNDVNQVNQSLFLILRIVIMAPIIAFFASIKILNTNKNMSIILIISMIITFIIIVVLFKLVFPKISYTQKLLDKVNLITKENLIGIKTIKAFNKEKYQIKKFDKTNKELLNINNYINKVTLLLTPLVTFIINITTIFIIYIGSKEIIVGNLKIGLMISYIEYMMQIMAAFLMISILFITIPKASVSNKRIKEVMYSCNTILNNGKSKIDNSNINIEFNNVCFSYNKKEKFLKDVNFQIKHGEKIGIIGGFASGKSTLANLLTRVYDIDSGNIFINNKDIKEYDLINLRNNISLCNQENIIYNGTIKENLLKFKKQNTKNIKKILKVSKLNKFVKLNEINKYKVSSDGKNLSGGQAKRLCIGRCLNKNSSIYIFDDSLNSIDNKTANEIINEIIKYLNDKIVIFMTQRIDNIKNFDKIILMNNGEIINIGNHEYLLNNSKIYKEIYDSQRISEVK